jgi:hypothetical protein
MTDLSLEEHASSKAIGIYICSIIEPKWMFYKGLGLGKY